MRIKRSFQARLQSANPNWNSTWGHKNPSCPTTSVEWGGGGTGVFFHIARGCTFHTDRKYKKHNILKLSTIFHRMILTCTLPELEYQEQSNIDNNFKGRLRVHLDVWKSIGAYINSIETIYNGYRIPFIETPSPFFFSKITILLFKIQNLLRRLF